MIAEYAAIAGAPQATDPWTLVLDVAQRADQFEARRHLTLFDAVTASIGAGLGGEVGAIESMRSGLSRTAYPSQSNRPEHLAFPPNAFAEDFDG